MVEVDLLVARFEDSENDAVRMFRVRLCLVCDRSTYEALIVCEDVIDSDEWSSVGSRVSMTSSAPRYHTNYQPPSSNTTLYYFTFHLNASVSRK